MNQLERKDGVAILSLAALGVVYGDIGTSPLYAIKEVFGNAHHPVPITPGNVLGILSLVFWSLVIVVSLKYVLLILRADNNGEGGIMALMARVLAGEGIGERTRRGVVLLGLFGAALFYGDGLITPAISVLSAVEGLEVATPVFAPYIVPITLGVVVGLFSIQRHGTARVGVSFGPITALWFIALAVLGIAQIAGHPAVMKALWPGYALGFLAADPGLGFLAMGSVFLAVTGAEALYADMGHFGRTPIRLAWFGLVLPALLLNYFGQGALLLADPATIRNPFYLMAPDWFLLPLVGLATAATVIASQAVISGVYSITQQAIQLGYAPRMELEHTSGSQIGQIYMPGVNWLMLFGVAALVLAFRSSSSLAAAYGIAVTGTMIITTLFAYLVARHQWQWSRLAAIPVFGALLALDLVFLGANSTKIVDGGWFPLVFGGFLYLLLSTWKRGRELLHERLDTGSLALVDFIPALETPETVSVPGTAIFMTPYRDHVPHALLHNLKHNKVLHERVVMATVAVHPVPRIPEAQRVVVERLSHRFYRVQIHFGFLEQPDVPAALDWCAEQGLDIDSMATSYFLGRETVVPQVGTALPYWREKLFATLYRNARTAADFFRLPPNQVVELGTRVVL
ncbi:MAG: potassium transporter Kup [Sterolibacteriaceae bacterium MAG5]|nr:potassium transporter Kup [Candidatus Nitricoxidireducens bremensis]